MCPVTLASVIRAAMKRLSWYFLLVLVNAVGGAPATGSFDWPQWQGAERTGVSRERGLLSEWSKDGPPLAWKIKGIGGGDGAPAIAAGRIFGLGNRGDEEVVWALSEADGQTIWTTKLGPAFAQQMPQGKEGPGCTPTVDGDRLYVLGLGGELACLQVKDGKILWHRSLTADFGGRVPTWSYRESPLVDGDKVICTPGGNEAMLVALDKITGHTLWKSAMPPGPAGSAVETRSEPDRSGRKAGGPGGESGEPRKGPGGSRGGRGGGGGSGAAYSSAIAVEFAGQRQYVQLTAKALIGVAASDGKFLWRYDAPANRMGINCSSPVYHDGMVFAASAYGTGGGLVKLSREAEGGYKATEVYFSKKMQNHHGGMILLEGSLYGANGGNEGGNLVCLDFKSGEVRWDERDRGKSGVPKGSVALADGRIYYRTEKGSMILFEPSPRQYLERGRFEQPDRSKQPAWAHPVIANGKLYLRDQDLLLCYDVKAK